MYEPPLALYTALSILQEPLSLNKTKLLKQLIEIESHQYELSKTRSEWLQKLYEARGRVLLPKMSKELTELDRKVSMDSSTAVIQKDLEFLQALETIVKDRLVFGKTLLATIL